MARSPPNPTAPGGRARNHIVGTIETGVIGPFGNLIRFCELCAKRIFTFGGLGAGRRQSIAPDRGGQIWRVSNPRPITFAWISAAPSKMFRMRASHSTRLISYSWA